ncbi:MAG: hypothetical protein J4215_05315 [Candidatus Diapherotrites archaeon]|uniref:tRNA (guanine(37)-N(1))-methyltransferase n=1 Tax=Candidatus Iainarchaeum sp. TaxID=3101447 RepID=A0A8T4L3R0_9ARCH|nr:hypothetical protein [Candidatus Diapherotrites archaeon]
MARLVEIKKGSRPQSLKERLKGILTPKEFEYLVSSFDSLGNVAIIEIPDELVKKEKKIGQALLETNPRFETIAKKAGAHKGRFRAEPLKVIAGKKRLLATYRESGCVFQIHLGKVFFSPRLGTERLRISKLIQAGETIGTLFAGVGPFPIVFAKNSLMKKAVAIELNPIAVKDMEFNIAANKVGEKVVPVLGDVNRIVPKKFKGAFDRITMPMPRGSEDFLDAALFGANPAGCVIHFYAFAPASDPFSALEKLITKKAKEHGFSVVFLEKKKVRSFSKEILQAVIDFSVKAQK